jgi:hypothetical protein
MCTMTLDQISFKNYVQTPREASSPPENSSKHENLHFLPETISHLLGTGTIRIQHIVFLTNISIDSVPLGKSLIINKPDPQHYNVPVP